jgi:hypothetical protein
MRTTWPDICPECGNDPGAEGLRLEQYNGEDARVCDDGSCDYGPLVSVDGPGSYTVWWFENGTVHTNRADLRQRLAALGERLRTDLG